MIKRIAILTLATIVSSPALAQECDQVAAQAKWEKAEKHQIILGAGMVNNTIAFSVDEKVWEQADLNARMGMVKTFECLIAGPDNVLTEAHVLNKGGEVLAVWDGVYEELNFQ